MTASTQTRVGIIGAGYIATWHADAIKATPGAQLVAVCDQSQGCGRGSGPRPWRAGFRIGR